MWFGDTMSSADMYIDKNVFGIKCVAKVSIMGTLLYNLYFNFERKLINLWNFEIYEKWKFYFEDIYIFKSF